MFLDNLITVWTREEWKCMKVGIFAYAAGMSSVIFLLGVRIILLLEKKENWVQNKLEGLFH